MLYSLDSRFVFIEYYTDYTDITVYTVRGVPDKVPVVALEGMPPSNTILQYMVFCVCYSATVIVMTLRCCKDWSQS